MMALPNSPTSSTTSQLRGFPETAEAPEKMGLEKLEGTLAGLALGEGRTGSSETESPNQFYVRDTTNSQGRSRGSSFREGTPFGYPPPNQFYAPQHFTPSPQHLPPQYGHFSPSYPSEPQGSRYSPVIFPQEYYYPSSASSTSPFPGYSPYVGYAPVQPSPPSASPTPGAIQNARFPMSASLHAQDGSSVYENDGSPAVLQDIYQSYSPGMAYPSPTFQPAHYSAQLLQSFAYQPPQQGGYHPHYPNYAAPPHYRQIPFPQNHANPALARSTPASFSPIAYAPPASEGLTRGNLAQAHLREAVHERGGSGHVRSTGPRSALPKPPAHSPHALWVGNVPSDSNHTELWHFFTSRPVPATNPKYSENPESVGENVDLHSTGVESIHLIARSNCAFVNYASDLHLQHAIQVSHGRCLRPYDTRCKDLVCRVRKRDEDAKSGVGAQRVGGLHHEYVSKMRRTAAEEPARPHRHSTSSTHHSISTTSTSSSFLGRNFPKRYFVLKSHDEDDLRLSVERGLWATQSHNEPVLDQAFRSSHDGVFLFFSANKSGEWYGYAKMSSPIATSQDRRLAWSAKGDGSSGSNSRSNPSTTSSNRPPTIPEDDIADQGRIFSPSEQRYADKSPMPLTPSGLVTTHQHTRGDSAPAKLPAARVAQLSAVAGKVGANLHLPSERRGDSLDPKILATVRGVPSEPVYVDASVLRQEAMGASDIAPEMDDDGVWRKDTLPTAEERNARLEKMDDEAFGEKSSAQGWGRPFKVEWIKRAPLPFSRTRNILNGFNANREIKISRDGTEIEPLAGEQLIAAFWREEGGAPPSTSPTASP